MEAELEQQVELHPGLPPRPFAEAVAWCAQRFTETGPAGSRMVRLVRGNGACHRLRRWGTPKAWGRL